MIIYLDYVFFVNFLFDFILLCSLGVLLKRNVRIYRLVLGGLFGGISIFSLFLNIPSFLFFVLKLFLGIIMIIITFNYKDIKYTLNNFFYLVILSIILGGSLYLVNNSFNLSNNGLLFFSNGNKVNIFVLSIVSIIILYMYIKIMKKYKILNSTNYEVSIFYNNKCLKLHGYLDTGNTLCDPYFNKPVLILDKRHSIKANKIVLVPFNTAGDRGVMECFFVDKVVIKDVGEFTNVLIGNSDVDFLLDGVDILLNIKLWEE